jgi:hypothetical protein
MRPGRYWIFFRPCRHDVPAGQLAVRGDQQVPVPGPGERPALECEADIAAVLDYRGRPAVIVGEVKSRMKSIDVNDLSHLKTIQQHIRDKGVECFVLAAVMRELREDETRALRTSRSARPAPCPRTQLSSPSCPSSSQNGTCPRPGTTSTTRVPGHRRTASSA